MKKLSALFIVMFIYGSVFCQFNYKNAFKLNLLGPYNMGGKPGIEMQYERFYSPKNSLNVEAIYMVDILKTYTFFENIDNWRGAAVAVSNRISLKQNSGLAKFREKPFVWRMFVAPGIGFSHSVRDLYWNFYYQDDITYRDYFSIRRNETALFTDVGYSYNIGKISVEYYMGLGYMFRYVKHLERDYINDKPQLDAEYYLSEYESPRNYNMPMFRYKVCVGYSFN